MTDECKRHASAADTICSPVIAEAMFLTIFFAHHQKLKELQEKVDKMLEVARAESGTFEEDLWLRR
jgi:hypothetical protein